MLCRYVQQRRSASVQYTQVKLFTIFCNNKMSDGGGRVMVTAWRFLLCCMVKDEHQSTEKRALQSLVALLYLSSSEKCATSAGPQMEFCWLVVQILCVCMWVAVKQ
uniref:Uncharacterized protein n=2 Tax=Triticum urartu TaxID=4572 RepID=A0A8R7TSA1_TRIUA